MLVQGSVFVHHGLKAAACGVVAAVTDCGTLMNMIARCFALALASVALSTPNVRAADTAATPDFKEVQQIVREHLAGATDETVNRAAVEGLLAALKGRVTMVTNTEGATKNVLPLVSRHSVFDGSVGYVRIEHVEAGLAEAVAAEVREMGVSNKLSGLVLDLRFVDGDDYAAATSTVDLFLKSEVPLLNAGKGLVSSREKTNAIRMPVVALVNGETGAAAEAVAAMLRQTGAGLLIGGRTAGRAGVTTDFKLSSGQTVRVVTAPIQLGDAKPIPATGLIPDIEVAVKAEDEKDFYADSFSGATNVANQNGSSRNPSTNTTAAARSAKRIRVTEADLVREKRGDGDFETVTNARVKSEVEVPVIQDPALARAVDLLKGLAVVRQGKL